MCIPLYKILSNCSPKSRVYDWKWEYWVIGHMCLPLYKILSNCSPKSYTNVHSFEPSVRLSATSHPIFCGCCWCLTQIPFTDGYTLAQLLCVLAANGSQMSLCWRIALGDGSLTSCKPCMIPGPVGLYSSLFFELGQR